MLCKGPNAKATTVHARHITLYGILKSGVGNDTIAPLVRNIAGYPENINKYSNVTKNNNNVKNIITLIKLIFI